MFPYDFMSCAICVHARCMCVSPQSFLRSEVSAENILFWQACEKFRKIPVSSVDEVWWHFLAVYMVNYFTCHLLLLLCCCVFYWFFYKYPYL